MFDIDRAVRRTVVSALLFGNAGHRLLNTAKVVVELSGALGGADWHWIAKLDDGSHVYIRASLFLNKENGLLRRKWRIEAEELAPTVEEVLWCVPHAIGRVFGEMIRRGEPRRKTDRPDVPYARMRATELVDELAAVEALFQTDTGYGERGHARC